MAANPEDGLQPRTCYSPSGKVQLGRRSTPFNSRTALYLPEVDVCIQTLSTEAGASAELATFDGSAAQNWVFNGAGTIAPSSSPEMCLILTGETRMGRSDHNRIIAIKLQACSDDQAAYQTWSNRTAE
ncbi:ricin-type beta-trefoil lectin domain protein [Ruegeria lacuscaerulensis]|uniref:ricin-type beta-trefoil lectin domain protein n=1 Tax=Ruegeria lacuscaerulensis TaxID=55218 RepID=UPI001480807B